MTPACLFSRRWLIPYAESESRLKPCGVLETLAWDHLGVCPDCQIEIACLRSTGVALQSAARASRRVPVKDDLSSTLFAERVLTRVYRDELIRRQIRQRNQRRMTATLSLGFALAVSGFAFTVYGPPSFARTWFVNTFHPAPVHVHHAHPKRPPFSMHDPFGSYGAHRYGSGALASRKSKNAHRHDVLAKAPLPASEPDVILDPQAAKASVEEAREATIVAEEAERSRWEKSRAIVVPSPSGARLATASAQSARTAAASAPPLLLATADSSGSGTARARSKTETNYYAPSVALANSETLRPQQGPAPVDELRSYGLVPSAAPSSSPSSPDPTAPASGNAP